MKTSLQSPAHPSRGYRPILRLPLFHNHPPCRPLAKMAPSVQRIVVAYAPLPPSPAIACFFPCHLMYLLNGSTTTYILSVSIVMMCTLFAPSKCSMSSRRASSSCILIVCLLNTSSSPSTSLASPCNVCPCHSLPHLPSYYVPSLFFGCGNGNSGDW